MNEENIPLDKLEALVEAPVFLLGMPRSGTTWLSQIFESAPEVLMRLSPNYSYALKNKLDGKSEVEDWRECLRQAVNSNQDPFMTQNWRREKGELEWIEKDFSIIERLFIKDTRFFDLYLRSVELFKDAKIAFIIRHPCGHLNSWRKSKEFPAGKDFLSHWRDGAGRRSEGPGEYWGFDDWKRAARMFLEAQASRPDQVLVFRYEDLVASPIETTSTLFDFMNLKMSEEVASFLKRSHSRHDSNVFSVFRSPEVAQSWRSELPDEVKIEVMNDIMDTDLARYIR
ncbi:sulfotransferase [Halovulum dunhuangense]|uniref:Sulfotransferase n=1 Tax=Halovulum dunhuangense TaxID=1505036 RepID=A0A849L6K6_9RHOB|nr:sulfotransferase [Halovulum dunhuangense]NNU81782.1 sulfotransferase [Halovulum dunhuangense]